LFKSYISEVADQLVNEYGTRDPFELAGLLGIEVKLGDFAKLKGFYYCVYDCRYISISMNIPRAEAALICAHELGHDQLHRDLLPTLRFLKDETLFSTDKVEYEADNFAANLLITDDLIDKYANSGYTIKQIAANENLYPQLVKLKLKKIKGMDSG